MKKKTLALALAAVMIFGAAVGVTLAWLKDATKPVTNVFSPASINITLEETERPYKMVPGVELDKDPVATVKAGSEDAWLFVKIDKSANLDAFISYAIAEGWTVGDGDAIPANVIYRGPVEASDTDQSFQILKDNKVQVKGEVTKEALDALTEETNPTLTFTAYATQYMKNATENFTAAEAWVNAQP